MRLVLVVAALLLTENLALPVGKEGQREDVITRCLVEVLSKALSKPDSQLDQECKDVLQTGIKHAPPNKKSAEGIILHEEVVKGQPEGTEAKTSDVKDIESLLQSVAEKRDPPENEQGQESWNLGGKIEKGYENEVGEAREKRGNWRPGRYHQKHHKRGDEEEDYERSQESWGLFDKKSVDEEEDEEQGDGAEREKRKWRSGRYHQKPHKRGEDEDYERSQESWGAFDKRAEDEEEEEGREDDGEREKRKWRHGRYPYQKPHKRDEESLGEEREEPEEERSQESWDVDKRYVNEEEEERSKRRWRPRYQLKKIQRRGDEPSEVGEDEERSQESWGLDGDERDKRNWRPGRYHQRRHKRDEELSEEGGREDPDDERSQEYWDFDAGRYKRNWRPGRRPHQRRHKRDEELPEEAAEDPYDRSQEYWDFDSGIYKRNWRPGRRPHQRRHKRDEELPEEAAEDPYERSQEYWDFDTGIYKRDWRPSRYHQRRHKRDEELAEEKRDDEYGERSQEYWDFDKRHDKEEGEMEKRTWKPMHRYYHKKKLHRRDGESSENDDVSEEYEDASKDRDEAERYLPEKRNPWIYRGFYHPAWYKREPSEHAANSEKMDELAKMVSYKINQLAGHSNQEVVKRSTHQRVLSPQEDKELGNLAAMDTELQKIATKLHDNSA